MPTLPPPQVVIDAGAAIGALRTVRQDNRVQFFNYAGLPEQVQIPQWAKARAEQDRLEDCYVGGEEKASPPKTKQKRVLTNSLDSCIVLASIACE